MRKPTLLFSFILFSTFLFSQQRNSGTVEIMPNIGYSISYLNGDEVENLDSRSAVQFGLLTDYYLNQTWSLRTGLSYFSMGAKIPDYELNLDYLNIPIEANWHFGKQKQWNLHFGAAPGFLLNAQLGGEDVKEFYKSFQLSISYGIGYKFVISDKFNITLETQGLFGVTNIIESPSELNRLNAGGSINIGGVFIL